MKLTLRELKCFNLGVVFAFFLLNFLGMIIIWFPFRYAATENIDTIIIGISMSFLLAGIGAIVGAVLGFCTDAGYRLGAFIGSCTVFTMIWASVFTAICFFRA